MYKIYGSRILSGIFSTDKYILGFVSDGFGNKMYMITQYIYLYFKINMYQKLDKIYLVYRFSDHEKQREEERLDYIFPKIKDLKFIKFISWDDYEKLKKGLDNVFAYQELIRHEKFSELKLPFKYFDYNFKKKYFLAYKSYFRNLFSFRDSFKKLDNKFDFNIPLLHIRLGDKIWFTGNCILNNKGKKIYAVLTPEFYRDISKQYDKVYVSTDSPELFDLYYRKVLNKKIILINHSFYNIFYLMTKFKILVLSESTLSIFASYLNKNLVKCYGHKYYLNYSDCIRKEKRVLENKLFLKNIELLEDEKYLLHNNKDLLKKMYQSQLKIKNY